MRRICPALVCFAWIAGAIWALAGTASAAPASHSRHATAAPGNLLTLSNYVMQPPGDVGEGDGDVVKDSTGARKVLEPKVQQTGADTAPTQPTKPPAWAFPDSAARGDSATVIPTSPASLPAVSGPPHPAAKARRGVLGIHPIALLVGMIALHVFVVGLANK
jgi:hypothetical protein